MSRGCGRARRVLWPGEGPRATTPEVEDAQRHLAGCGSCRRFFARMRETTDVLRRHAPRPEAPTAVRERIFRAVARERTRGGGPGPVGGPDRGWAAGPDGPEGAGDAPARWRRWLAAALAAVLLVAGTWTMREWDGSTGTGEALGAFVEDHLRALHPGEIESSDPGKVRRWLAERVAFAVSVPRLPGAEIEGGRLCFLEGRTGTVIRYRVAGKPVSYYVMPADGSASARSQADAFRSEARSGYHVVAWRHEGLVHALVGDLPRDRLSELARVCSETVAATPGADPARFVDEMIEPGRDSP